MPHAPMPIVPILPAPHVCARPLSCVQLNLRNNYLGPEGAKALAPALAASASLTSLDVRYNNIPGDGASQLSSVVLGNTKIEVFNEVPIKEMRADSFTELNLQRKNIGVEGGMVVAGLLPVMASLTRLEVKDNLLREEGEAALRKATEGRSGFELLL